eukprot:NODE_14613_length_1097_cov_8.058763.p7 GENE.NODE_14613_length_1097_cov_8.058763~~NODE_14613_length_1097_cov_8.058763.p7  ORF type:complete len:74 (+),score=21.79 NODE_14613_length_1097_cov_8.058763:784-1005(+)
MFPGAIARPSCPHGIQGPAWTADSSYLGSLQLLPPFKHPDLQCCLGKKKKKKKKKNCVGPLYTSDAAAKKRCF